MTGADDIGLLRSEASSQRATFLELFFDLVFVFALTRVSQRLITDFDSRRHILLSEVGRTLLLFLALWLLWALTAMTTSRLEPNRPEIQFLVVASMLGAMVMAVALPKGFDERAAIFAGAYVAVQIGRTAFLWIFHRPERPVGLRVLVWQAVAAVPWIAGAVVTETGLRGVLWTIGILLDYAGAAFGWPMPRIGRVPIDQWSIAGEHLAERYQQFLLITLGETILVIGLTFSGVDFVDGRTTAFLVAFLTTALIWRVYFHRAGQLLPVAITVARRPARLGLGMAYTHLLMVAGIVLTGVGYELYIIQPLGHVAPVWLYAILGGPALFLIGRVLFEYQVFARISWPRGAGLLLLLLLAPVLVRLPPLASGVVAAATLAGVAAADLIRSRGRVPDQPTPPV